jgi:hypothetical protein
VHAAARYRDQTARAPFTAAQPRPKKSAVKHITLQTDDVPVAPFIMDRRRTPDRRATWRGGRRDTDWQHRPPGTWDRVATQAWDSEARTARLGTPPGPLARWRLALATLHLW